MSGPGPKRLEVGRILKPHGLRGELVVALITNMVRQRSSPGTVLWLADGSLTVRAARRHKDKWLYSFVEITDRLGAESLAGQLLFADELLDSDEVFVHQLVGKRLLDQNDFDHGEIEAVLDNPAADLLELTDGRLVPLSFMVSYDDHSVMVDVPVGLLDDDYL